MLLSIITPVYNCEKFVEESLTSLCDQDFSYPTELILINDGSEDNTWKIVEEKCMSALDSSSLSSVRVFNEKVRMFLPTRRNQAINVSEGIFIAIHDGDDISLPGRFNRQVRFLMENDNIFCVGGHAKKIDSNSDPIGEMSYPPRQHDRIVLEFYEGKMNPVIDPTTMFRSKYIRDLGGYSLAPDKYTVPDFDLWLRSISCGYKFYNIQEQLITYRINSEGMTRKHNTVMVDQHKKSMKEFRDGQYKINNSNWLDNTLELKHETIKCVD
tara:strand:+ start:214 stop:1020 length:807 start_codon:yes stop_codon:yes gene_type:complete